jgi:hypothetical protein
MAMKPAERLDRDGFRHLRFGLVLMSALFPAMVARGQEALRSNLAQDESMRPPGSVGEGSFASVRLGPLLGHLQLYTSATYDDNVKAAETDLTSDEIINIGINASFIMPVGYQSQLSFNIGAGYATYLQHTLDSTLNITPDSALSWDISFPNGYLTLFDALSYTTQVYNEGSLANVAELPRWDNTAGARITWSPRHWVIQTGYSYDKVFTTSSSDAYLNWNTQDIFLRTGWRFAEKTQAGIEASASFTSYASGSLGDTSSYSIGPYADWQITDYIRADLHGGPTLYDLGSTSVAGSTSKLNSYYLRLGLYHQLTEHLSHSLNVQRNVELGLNQGSQYIEDFLATYAISWTVTSRTQIGLTGTYEDGNQPLPQTVSTIEIINSPPVLGPPPPSIVVPVTLIEDVSEHFRRYGGGPQITWLITNNTSAILSYNFWVRKSNLPHRNYVDNAVSLNLNYSF